MAAAVLDATGHPLVDDRPGDLVQAGAELPELLVGYRRDTFCK
jgi:hypothetical protein